MDKTNPDTICNISVIPKINPIFHINEIEEGDGRSIKDLFIIDISGFFFDSCVFIKMMLKLFDSDDDRA